MDDVNFLAERFEENRGHLLAVGYRMLGSLNEAEDAVQEAWLRLSRADAKSIDNLNGWLTTVVARVCLDMLRTRKSRREESLDVFLPDPIVSRADGSDPEHEAILADSVGLALLVVLEMLTPAERLAFVLHDMFAMPFDEVAPIVGKSTDAVRQLASRARRRVQGAVPDPDTDISGQRRVVDAFLAAARNGDFEALVEVLDPDVVLRVSSGVGGVGTSRIVHGASKVAANALSFARFAPFAQPVLVNGGPGFIAAPEGQPVSVAGFTIKVGRIVEIHILADPERLRRIDLTFLND